MININDYIFTRTQPQKKLRQVSFLSESELLAIKEDTITKMVKDAGRKIGKTRDKRLSISNERRKGNNWNSLVEAVELIRGRLYLDFYVQFGSTDRNTNDLLEDFLQRGSYRGEIHYSDRYDNPQTAYFCYDQSDKAEVVRAIVTEYLYTKYADKLQ